MPYHVKMPHDVDVEMAVISVAESVRHIQFRRPGVVRGGTDDHGLSGVAYAEVNAQHWT